MLPGGAVAGDDLAAGAAGGAGVAEQVDQLRAPLLAALLRRQRGAPARRGKIERLVIGGDPLAHGRGMAAVKAGEEAARKFLVVVGGLALIGPELVLLGLERRRD